MSAATLAAFIARCRILCRPHKNSTDAELLERFTRRRDADAFAQILERYAGLVWGVCQRIVPQESDCEDAFQAVFLAMVRRPDLIDPRQSLGAWLHTVSMRMSGKALLRSHRQQPCIVVPERAEGSRCGREIASVAYLSFVVEDDEEEGSGVEIDAGIESGVGSGLEVAHEDLDVSMRRSKRLSALSFKCASRVFMSIQSLQKAGQANNG